MKTFLDRSPSKHVWLDEIVIFLWGAAVLLPFPRLLLGNTASLQPADFLGLAVSLVLVLRGNRFPRRHLLGWLALLAPAAVSLMFVGLLTPEKALLSVRVFVMWGISTYAVVVAGLIPIDKWRYVLMGISSALVLHGLVAAYQWYAFSVNEFPLAWVFGGYHDEKLMKAYAMYTKRPFGLFQEPSALAAAVGCWLVLLLSMLGGVAKIERLIWRKGRVLLASAVTLGLFAMVISRTRFMIFFLLVLVFVGLTWLSERGISIVKTYWRTLAIVVISGLLVVVFWASFESRFGESTVASNLTIDPRAGSIADGIELWIRGDMATIFFGMGIGQSALHIQYMRGWDAAWSVLLTNVIETGMIGIVSWTFLGAAILGAILRSGAKIIGLAYLGAWFVGVAITTSYFDLSSVWVALGFMLSWNQFTRRSNKPRWRGGVWIQRRRPGSTQDSVQIPT
jgi:hypothetical protein